MIELRTYGETPTPWNHLHSRELPDVPDAFGTEWPELADAKHAVVVGSDGTPLEWHGMARSTGAGWQAWRELPPGELTQLRHDWRYL